MVDIKEENGKSTTTLVIETIVGRLWRGTMPSRRS